MQQERGSHSLIGKGQGYAELASLLVLFLHEASPDTEHRLSLFDPDLYLQIIFNTSESKEVRQASCAALRAQVVKKEVFQPHAQILLAKVETLYFGAEAKLLEEIEGSFQIVIQRLFEMYLDDEKKLKGFENLMNRLNTNTDIRRTSINIRALKLGSLLIRSMDSSTLNNQICIGELMCYFKQVYLKKHQTNDIYNINGRGLEILGQLIGRVQYETHLNEFLQLQIEVVGLVRQILDRIQIEDLDNPIPTYYLRNSEEIKTMLESMLCVSIDGKVYGINHKVNQLKAAISNLYAENYLYHISQELLILCFSTITRCNLSQLADETQNIVSDIMQFIERSTNHSPYVPFFYNNTQILVLKLFQLISVRNAELQAIENDPQHFVEISDDFCKNQHSQMLKIRAGSLLYNLCLTIDGNLTFITNMALIPLTALEKSLQLKLFPDEQVRIACSESQKSLKVLLELWNNKTPQSFTQTSLIIISSISDLLTKRNQFYTAIRTHLQVMRKFFAFKDKIVQNLPPLIISRYIQLFSFFSFPNCLDVFLPYYNLKPVYSESILKALDTIIIYHDKKSQEMRQYVILLSTRVLLLTDKLTSLLQKTILEKPEIIACVKEKVVEKLVIWLLKQLQDGNVLTCNKLSNLLCKFLEKYPQFIIGTDQFGFNYDLEALTQYLLPLYKKILGQEQHPSEQCIIDVAVQHVECLGAQMSPQFLKNVVQMGITVVRNNNYTLNKCLQLFSRTLSLPSMQRNAQKMEYIKLRRAQLELTAFLLPQIFQWLSFATQRDTDLWQLLFLLQITLTNRISENQPFEIDCNLLKNIYAATGSLIVKIKIYIIWLITVEMNHSDQNQAAQCLQKIPIPDKLPPFEKDNFAIYLMRAVPYFTKTEYQVYFLKYIIGIFYPSETCKKYWQGYEKFIHISSTSTQAEIDAFQTVKTVLHPINSMGFDIYKEFRMMIARINNLDEVRQLLNPLEEAKIKEIMNYQMVGTKARKIIHVKKRKQ